MNSCMIHKRATIYCVVRQVFGLTYHSESSVKHGHLKIYLENWVLVNRIFYSAVPKSEIVIIKNRKY